MSTAACQIVFTTGLQATGITVTSSNGHGGIGWFEGFSLQSSITQDAQLKYDSVNVLDTTVQVAASNDFDNLVLTLQDASGNTTGKVTTGGVGFGGLLGWTGDYSTV